MEISRRIAEIDDQIHGILTAILEHPAFAALKSRWASLGWMVELSSESPDLGVMMLQAKEAEIDAPPGDENVDFRRLPLYGKLFTEIFDQPGAVTPVSLLVIDQTLAATAKGSATEAKPRDPASHRGAYLTALARIGQETQCPILLSGSPDLVGLESFADCDRVATLQAARQRETGAASWRRAVLGPGAEAGGPGPTQGPRAEFAFLSVAVPDVMIEPPRRDLETAIPEPGGELCPGRYHRIGYAKPVWARAGFAVAALAMRHHQDYGWFFEMPATPSLDEDWTGSVLVDLPLETRSAEPSFSAAPPGVSAAFPKSVARVLESEFGFTVLESSSPGSEIRLRSMPSLRLAQVRAAGASIEAHSQTNVMLSLCRISQALVLIGRSLVGRSLTPGEIEEKLRLWLRALCNDRQDLSIEEKARRPLRNAQVVVSEETGMPGHYRCKITILPHARFDDATPLELTAPLGRQP